MDIIKVTSYAVITCFLLIACNSGDNAEKEKLQKEILQLKEERNQMTEQAAKAQKLIDGIWSELNTVSGRAFELERNREENSRTQNLKKAEEIAKDIKEIKKHLDEAEETEGINETMRKTIANLRITLRQKENEIIQLKTTIDTLRKTNKQQIEDLRQQRDQLNSKIAELNKSNFLLNKAQLQMQANSIAAWTRVGDELMRSVKRIGPKKGNGNMEVVKNAQLEMILRSIDSYQKAYDLGQTKDAFNKLNRAIECYHIYQKSDRLVF